MRTPKRGILLSIGAASLFLACASPRVAYKKDFDFASIRTVRVGAFSSSARASNSGSVVAGEFVRQLLSSGYSIKTSEEDAADVVLEGDVTEYLPNQRYLIQTNKDGEKQQVIVTYPPVELSGTNVYNLGTTFGLGEGNQVVVSNATVGISAFLKDARTGEIIWSNTYTYEGLDLTTALESTVRYLLRSWPGK